MADPDRTAHLDDLAVSAQLDGEADHSAHLATCRDCRARLEAVRGVVRAVATPPPSLPADVADRLVATAVDVWTGASADAPATVIPLDGRRQRSTRWLAVAALVLVALAAVPIVVGGRSDDARVQQATGGAERDPGSVADSSADAFEGAGGSTESASELQSGAFAFGPVSDGDLGPRRELDEVAIAVRARLDTPSGGDDTGPPIVAMCEADARGDDSEVGALVYVATLTWRGVEAEALAFQLADAPGDYRLAIMARSGCGLLARGRI